MEIVQERLEREFDLDLVTTAPGVLYRVTTTDGEVQEIDSPAKLPDAGRIEKIEEPVITAMILTPSEYVGGILQLCQDKRGVQKGSSTCRRTACSSPTSCRSTRSCSTSTTG